MTPTAIRWLIIPPGHGQAAWREAVIAHASAQGIAVTEIITGNEHPGDGLAISADIDFCYFAGAQDADMAVVDLSPWIDVTDGTEAERPHIVLDRGRKITAAAGFKGLRISPNADSLPAPLQGLKVAPSPALAATPLDRSLKKSLTYLHTDTAEWEPPVFFYNTRYTPTSEVGDIDITGRARALIYGPYLFLRPGRWRATMRISFDRDAAKKLYHVLWGGAETKAELKITPGKPGIYEIEIEQDWHANGACELQLFLMEGAFHGDVKFYGAKIERIGEPVAIPVLTTPEAPDVPLDAPEPTPDQLPPAA